VLDHLFDFQREDFEKLRPCDNVLVGNEMGTGKTLEAIALDLYRRDGRFGDKTLVVAPLTALPVWQEHLENYATGRRHIRMIDPKNRNALLAVKADYYLVHYEALRLMPELQKVEWLHIIADECHRMKNRKAQQTRALKAIKGRYKTAMSGTPVVNVPHEFWSVLNWLYPQTFRSYWKFYAEYVDYEIQYPQGYHKVTGPKNEKRLLEQIKPFYVRRLKKDVLKDLPDKYYTKHWVELYPKQRKAYDQMRKDLIAWVGEHQETPLFARAVVAQLVRLQQFAVAYADVGSDGVVALAEPSSKLDALMEILEDNPDEQVVVFSQFKKLVRLLESRLQKEGVPYVTLTGDTNQNERGRNVVQFQTGRARVFVGTIAAGGVGITLHAASTVVFLDRSWSPALNGQAEDRLHRIGQKSAVQVIDLMAKDTVDLGRHQRLEVKLDWIRRLLGDK
jgi:SNF2 family DNA or RNA helicase